MSLIKKSDVKNHLSPGSHRSNHIHIVQASIPMRREPDTEQTAVEVALSPSFVQDYIADQRHRAHLRRRITCPMISPNYRFPLTQEEPRCEVTFGFPAQ